MDRPVDRSWKAEAQRKLEEALSKPNTYMSDVEIVLDKDCPPGTAYLVEKNSVLPEQWEALAVKYHSTREAREPRRAVLEDALQAVTQDRNVQYGNPEDNFADIAAYWNLYIKQNYQVEIQLDGVDVALMMDLMKTARIKNSPTVQDHWTDKAGYSSCGYRCAVNG